MMDRGQVAGPPPYFTLVMIAVAVGGIFLYSTLAPGALAPTTPTPTATPEPAQPQVSFDGQPIEQTFRFDQGSAYPDDWNWPVRVEFQRPKAGNWTEVYAFNVALMEWFTVELVADETYRIVVQDADGDRRSLGLYIPKKPGVEHTIIIGGCCVDDFSPKRAYPESRED